MADYTVGEAYVELKPSARGFSREAKKALAAVDLDKSVDLEADATKLEAAVKAAKQQLDSLNREKVNPSIDFDVSVAEAKIAEVQAKLDELSRKEATPKVATQTAEAQRDLASLTRRLDELNARKASVNIDADITAASTNLRELEAKLDEVNRRRAEPKVTADTSTARQRLDELDGELRRVSSLRATPKIELAVAQAQQQALAIRAELDRLGAMRPSAQVDADIASASAKLAVLNAELNKIDGRNVRVDADASGLSTVVGVAGLVAGALGAIPAAASAAAGALAGLSGIAGAAGQGIGAALLGFSGISDALKAVESDEKAAATSSAASSKTRASGANQVASAQASLQQAQTQADRAAITGAQQVASAQQSLQQARTAQARTAVQGAQQVADAERALQQAVTQAARQRITSDQQVAQARRAVSDAITSSNQRVAAAEASLASAQRGRQYAQEALTRATEDATRANRDLQLSVSGAGLAEQRAALSLAQARDRLAKANTSDPLELADLSLSVQEAEQNLKEVQVRYGDLRGEQSKWAQTGIQGSDQVVAATRALQDAQRGVASAQGDVTQAQVSGARAVADAQMSLTQTVQQANWQQADSAASVADAQRGVQRAAESAAQANADAASAVAQAQDGVAKAVQQAAWQQADAAKGVQDAQRALAQAYETTGEAGASGAKQAQYALSKLSPEGRAFVDFLTKEWKPAWENTSKEIAGRMLPGIQAGMKSLLTLQPQLTAALSDTGAIIGDVAARAGAMMASGPFAKSFASIMASNNRMLEGMGDAALSLLGAFTDLWTVAGPIAEQFVRLGTNAAQAFESWIIGEKASGDLQKSLQSGADTMMWLGGVLKDLVVDLYNTAQGFAPLAGALIEIVRSMADFVAAVTSFSPTLTSLVAGFGLAWAAVSKLNTALKGMTFLTTVSQAGALGGSLKTLLVPSALAATDGMQRFGAAATNAATKVGVSQGAATKFGGAMTKVGSALPVVGAALIGIGIAVDAMVTSFDEAVPKWEAGGQAARDLAAELDANAAASKNAETAAGGFASYIGYDWVRHNVFGIETTESFNQKLEEQRSKMSNLQRAQQDATKAQGDYELAVREFGASSPQAISALQNLNDRSKDVEIAQIAVREKTDLATAALIYQRDQILAGLDADLRKRQATQDLARDQQALADAIRDHGPASAEAEAASIQLEQTQLRVAEAARSGKDGLNGQARAIGEMVAKTKGELTPTLSGMVQSLDAAGLAAAGATVKVDDAGRAVAVFPNGKTVVLDANTSPALAGLDGVALKLNSVPGNKTVTVGTLSAEAEAKLTAIGFTVTHLPNGQVQVTANDAMARGTLIAFQQFAAWQQANPQLAADPAKSYEAMRGFLINAGQQTGVPMLDANPQRADQQVRDAVGRYNTTWSTMPVNSNPAEADRNTGAARDRAGAPVVFGLSANPDYKGITGFFNWLGDMISGAAGGFAHIFGTGGMNEVRRAMGLPPVANGGPIYPHAVGGLVGYASGGLLRGPGSGTSDSILGLDRGGMPTAMVSNGEYVIRAAAVKKLGIGTLDQINAMGGRAAGGIVGLAAGGAAKTQPMAASSGMASSSSAAPAEVAVPAGDPAATGAAASATSSLAASMATAAGQAAVLQPALTALAATQAGVLAPATAAVTAGQQAMVTGGILPLVGTMLSSLFPTLGIYQQQVGVAAPAANTALQTSQLATQAQTTATALNTALNSGLMNTAVTGMSLTGQAQHAALRGTQMLTQASNAQTATSTAINSQNMAISTTSMSTIGQQQHGNLRLSQGLTQASNNATAINTAQNNANMIATTGNMSATNQGHLTSLRGAQVVTSQATTAFADAWRAQLGRTMPDSGNPLRWVINVPIRSVTDAWNNLDAQFALGKRVNPYVAPFAEGGFHENHRATITRAGGPTRMWSEPETGGEAYIPLAQSKRSRSERILSEVAGRFGKAVVPQGDPALFADGGLMRFADGGLWRRLGGVAQQLIPGTRVSSGYRPGDPGYHGSGQAADLVGNLPLINRTLAQRYPNSTQLIYTPGINLFRGRPHTYNAATRADHFDHVHWAMQSEAMLNGAPGVYSGDAGGGTFDPTPMINEAFAKAYREIDDVPKFFGPSPQVARDQGIARFSADQVKAKATADLMAKFAAAAMGATSNEAPGIVRIISDVARSRFGGQARKAAVTGTATGLVESGLRNLPGGDRDSLGVFQQRPSQGWGTPAQIMNVTYAAGKFFSRFPGNWASMDQGMLAQSVQRSAFPAKYGQRMAQADGLVGQFGGFDNGGYVGPGMTLVQNNTGAPERILDNVETRNYDTLTRLMGRGGVKVDTGSSSGGNGLSGPIRITGKVSADLANNTIEFIDARLDAVTDSFSTGRRSY